MLNTNERGCAIKVIKAKLSNKISSVFPKLLLLNARPFLNRLPNVPESKLIVAPIKKKKGSTNNPGNKISHGNNKTSA